MNVDRVIVHDVYRPNDVYNFDREKVLQYRRPVRIGAISYVSRPTTWTTDVSEDVARMDRACADYARPVIFGDWAVSQGLSVYLFCAHGPWQPKSVMVQHRRLWKDLSESWQLANFQLSSEVIIESDRGLRFAGIAKVGPDEFFTSTQILRSEPSNGLIISSRDIMTSEADIRRIFEAAFPISIKEVRETRLELLNFVLTLCPLGDIVVRISGTWDEGETSIDMFMRSELLRYFESPEE